MTGRRRGSLIILMTGRSLHTVRYTRFLIFIAGMGGLLYGIDIGIIAAALLYLGKTVNLTVEQTSVIVAAVLGGGMCSSLVAGLLADWFGRRRMMTVSGLLFVASVGLIVMSQGFVPLLVGRLLQGTSGGVIAVVVPLYLAECLGAKNRGKGTAIFQFMLTFGIVIAALIGWFYTSRAEAAIVAAAGNAARIEALQNAAWRGMFLAVVYPGLIFMVGSFFLSESPRWLFRRGRREEALTALRKSSPEDEAQLQLHEMEELAAENTDGVKAKSSGPLLQRKYVIPFVLACIVLACNQTTGINSILSFLVIILKQAGMNARHATQGDVAVKIINCAMTLVAVAFVDRKGRKFLLKAGTGGIIVGLIAGALVFRTVESKRLDEKERLQQLVSGDRLQVPLEKLGLGDATAKPFTLTVLYSYGAGDRVATVVSSDPTPAIDIEPESGREKVAGLVIKRALYGPVPSETTGWLMMACMALFIASFAFGPGVVVWITLSELMPTRIRSTGMGIALLLNQGVSTLIAAAFLPVVGNYGYAAMFVFWALCTVVYFSTAAFFLPETKGKTLEEIEAAFDGAGR
jgi:MFS transporter, SP family, solute carrier family 2 (myo-inositol transporter), member 13